jgi:hypothetical protein
MDALELLHQDHQTVKELLQTAKESDDPENSDSSVAISEPS